MIRVRFAACAAFAGALALPAIASAQGPNHIMPAPTAAMASPPPSRPHPRPPIHLESPCASSPDAHHCLGEKLQRNLASHRISPARAAALHRRLDAARAQENKAHDAYRGIDAELHGG